ncbi:hypothetical protein L6164_037077 [Bauhinia variegata]|uniref:Uncharacterized protein n=1 Tax=Bauhinia variegata TaxID=167791 RepID=A0ACB9KJ12_BAUVA|nr:hypothetical protein L6164_037077 [Bauhinia variegata]
MKSLSLYFSVVTIAFLSAFTLSSSASDAHESFIQCLHLHFHNSTSISDAIYTQNSSSFSSILQFSIQNLRFASTTTPKPLIIVTPNEASQIQATVICSQKHSLQIRTRSGGHDYEGLSYVSQVPFVVIDLINLRKIEVDEENSTAWVQAGATIGELYYRIAEKSRTLGFPAGVCPTVGVGGHFSGGGYGYLLREHGLAADHIIDAHIIDVNGTFLDKEAMGDDLFWAIRGGGGASFGVILAWKIRLVPVPSTVTVFNVPRTLEQNGTKLVHRWQSVASKMDKDIFIRATMQRTNSSQGNLTVQASFSSLYLGTVDKLLPLMQESFAELGLTREDCNEMSWIESILYFAGFQGQSLEVLLNRTQPGRLFFKAKSDYVTEPIPELGLEGIWPMLYEDEAEIGIIELSPYGGRMDEISESEIPYPHRSGTLYNIQHLVYWQEEGDEAAQRYINWIRRLYDYFAPFVSKSPRAAYLNYRDLDIGMNNINGYTSYKQASIWGVKYFKNNFNRLVKVKTKVDPHNFFRNEQSIPSLLAWRKNGGN